MNTSEMKKRDYSLEHKRRKEKKTRLLVDLDHATATTFISLLHERGVTFSSWIKDHINDELKDLK